MSVAVFASVGGHFFAFWLEFPSCVFLIHLLDSLDHPLLTSFGVFFFFLNHFEHPTGKVLPGVAALSDE